MPGVLPAAFKPAAGRPGDQRVLRSATADSWGRLKGRWPLEWSQELHCSYSAHGCQTALRAGGFALDYGGSAVAAAGGAWLHVQYCRSKLLLVSRLRGGGQQLRFKLDGPTASGSAWLVGFAIPAADVSSSRPTVVLVALHVQNPIGLTFVPAVAHAETRLLP